MKNFISKFPGTDNKLSSFPLVVQVLSDPELTLELDLSQWDLLIRQARRANVLARLTYMLMDSRLLDKVPAQPLLHLQSAKIFSEQFHLNLLREIQCIEQALQEIDTPLIFLKGTAYVLADNRAAKGRVFSDLDILVMRDQLSLVEKALLAAGWRFQKLDAYDQKYYRQWMHELPPMVHSTRKSVLDVHHNIFPITSRLKPSAEKIIAAAQQITGQDYFVLSEQDRVLHSAAHLFHDGEVESGLRDLSDLDLLLREFAEKKGFWPQLVARSTELHLQRPLFYAVRYTSKLLQTPVPESVQQELEKFSPPVWLLKLMDALFVRALLPDHQSCSDVFSGFSRWLLYVRSHWQRMPFYLLLPHLMSKSTKRLRQVSAV